MRQWKTVRIVLFAVLTLGLVPRLGAQSTASSQPSGEEQEKGVILIETFEGSANSDGFVSDLNSVAGYRFNQHFRVDAGVPVYFIHSSSSVSGSSSSSGVGNPYVDLGWAIKNPAVNYSTNLNAAAPTADTKKGLSTGRVTFDWDNRFDREFSRFTPFADAGVGNSLSDRFLFRRPFTSLGNVAHLEGGTEFSLGRSLSLSASGYDVLPWGTQKVFSRLIKRGSAGSGTVKHGRVFENAAETIGGASLTRDTGFKAGFDFTPRPYVDFSLGYTRSMNYALDTVSFGVSLDVAKIIEKKRGL
jgi:hypothetical protein